MTSLADKYTRCFVAHRTPSPQVIKQAISSALALGRIAPDSLTHAHALVSALARSAHAAGVAAYCDAQLAAADLAVDRHGRGICWCIIGGDDLVECVG